MKFKILFKLILLLAFLPGQSQDLTLQWKNYFFHHAEVDDFVKGMISDKEGNTYVLAESVGNINKLLILKYDPSDQLLWCNQVGNGGITKVHYFDFNQDGNIDLFFNSYRSGLYLSINPNGTGNLQRLVIDADAVCDIRKTPDGKFKVLSVKYVGNFAEPFVADYSLQDRVAVKGNEFQIKGIAPENNKRNLLFQPTEDGLFITGQYGSSSGPDSEYGYSFTGFINIEGNPVFLSTNYSLKAKACYIVDSAFYVDKEEKIVKCSRKGLIREIVSPALSKHFRITPDKQLLFLSENNRAFILTDTAGNVLINKGFGSTPGFFQVNQAEIIDNKIAVVFYTNYSITYAAFDMGFNLLWSETRELSKVLNNRVCVIKYKSSGLKFGASLFNAETSGNDIFFLNKIDSQVKEFYYAAPEWRLDLISDLDVDQSGNSVVTGEASVIRSRYDNSSPVSLGYIRYFDENGVLKWKKEYEGKFNYRVRKSIFDSEGNLIIAGYEHRSFDTINHRFIKFDKSGDVLWEVKFLVVKDYQDQLNEHFLHIDSLNNLHVITGIKSMINIYVINQSGEIINSYTFTDPAHKFENLRLADQYVSGYDGFYLTKLFKIYDDAIYFASNSLLHRGFTVSKISLKGKLLWQQQVIPEEDGDYSAFSLTMDNNGIIHVTSEYLLYKEMVWAAFTRDGDVVFTNKYYPGGEVFFDSKNTPFLFSNNTNNFAYSFRKIEIRPYYYNPTLMYESQSHKTGYHFGLDNKSDLIFVSDGNITPSFKMFTTTGQLKAEIPLSVGNPYDNNYLGLFQNFITKNGSVYLVGTEGRNFNPNGVHYLKLKYREPDIVTDIPAGSSQVSSELNLFPNPANNKIYVLEKEFSEAEIFNSMGEKVSADRVDNTDNSIDVGLLPSGIYIVKLNGNNLIRTGRFVKY